MTFVDPGAIGECDARTQGTHICRRMGVTEDAERGRATQPSLCEAPLKSQDRA
jgi:hypothetical protein